MRAIVIHPDESRRTYLATLLEAWNIDTAVVNGGSTAIDVIRWSARMGRPFGFAIVDLTTALEKDRALATTLQDENAPLPMIAICDSECPPDIADELDAAACFTWPVSQSSLLEAVFRFMRPSSIPARATASSTSTATSRTGVQGRRILVAEDIPENRELVLAFFEGRDDKLEMVSNGREVVEAYRKSSFDLILMDMQMPEMGGVEATAAIRNMEELQGTRTPIIALTAHAMKGDRERYLASGMDGYVSKPIRPDDAFPRDRPM